MNLNNNGRLGRTPKTVFNKFELKTMQKAILNCLQI